MNESDDRETVHDKLSCHRAQRHREKHKQQAQLTRMDLFLILLDSVAKLTKREFLDRAIIQHISQSIAMM